MKLIHIPISDHAPHQVLAQWYGEYNTFSDYSSKYNSLSNIMPIVRKQKGIVFCLKTNQSYKEMKFFTLDPPVYLYSGIAWLPETETDPLMEKFISFLSTHYTL